MLAPDRSFQLMSTHPFLSFAQQQNGNEPNRQRQVGVMEDRPASRGELILTANALVAGIFFQSGHAGIFAPWANDAFGPAQPFQQFTASVVSRIEDIQLQGAS